MKTKRMIIASICLILVFSAISSIAGQKSDTWLGVYVQTIDENLMEAFDLDSNRGAIIKHVVPDSPAEKAGLRAGDVILKLGDKELVDSDDLSRTVSDLNPEDEVDILLIRDGKKETVTAILGLGGKSSLEPNMLFKEFGQPNRGKPKLGKIFHLDPKSKLLPLSFGESNRPKRYIGISLEVLNEQLGKYFGVKNGNGILITEVSKDSPAEKAGLKAGDVIIKIDGEKISKIAEIQKAVRQKEDGEKVAITLLRNKKKKKYSVEVAQSPEISAKPFVHPEISGNDFHSIFPKTKGMYYGDWNDKGFSADSHLKAIKKMQSDIEKLQKELKEIKERIN